MDPPQWVKCLVCGLRATRDYAADLFKHPREFEPFFSEAMGVGTEDERLPGEIYDDNNNLQVKSRRHQRKMKKQLGLVDTRSYVE